MSPSSTNTSGEGKTSQETLLTLQEYLHSDGPVSERLFETGKKSKKGEEGKGTKGKGDGGHKDKARAHIEQFDYAWAASTGQGSKCN